MLFLFHTNLFIVAYLNFIMNSAFKERADIKKNFKKNSNAYKYYILSGIILLTIIIYSKSIYGEFINWDDDVYITKNPDILNVSLNGLKNFFTNFYVFNYIPLTMLSFALEYKLFGLNPIAFHTNNLILHIVNIILVFILIYKIFKRTDIASITALFFAIHPMHVESVAWIAERKDVLYTLFYLLSLIFYVKYIQKSTIHKPNSPFSILHSICFPFLCFFFPFCPNQWRQLHYR